MDTRLTALRKEKRVETAMQMQKEIEALSRMTVGQLRQKYLEVFGEESRSNHKQFLFRRIAWRIQALAEGGLSERARRRALEIANDADLRIRAPRTMFGQDRYAGSQAERHPQGGRRSRLEAATARLLPGARVQGPPSHREGPGGWIRVRRRTYRSLSAIAREVTGTKWNGFLFFNLSPTQEAADGKK